MSHTTDTLVFVPFKFIHCADLHLDAVLRNAYRASDAEELSSVEIQKVRDAPLVALDRIYDHAISNKVDAVIIAGDIFDKKENATTNLRARSRFTKFLEKLSEEDIEVFIALGNHDPLDSINELKLSWPKNTHVFQPDIPHSIGFDKNDKKAVIHSVSYATVDESRDLASQFPEKVSGAINVGVLHTNVGSNSNHSNYAPSNLEQLIAYDYDYFALGHIHKREILSEHPMVAYSGNTQGLSAKPSEQTPKGCVLVTINEAGSEVETKFLPCDSIRFTRHDFAFDNLENIEELGNEIGNKLNETNSENLIYLSRVKITLNTEITNLDAEALRVSVNDSRLNTIITNFKIETPNINWEELTQSDAFFAELDRLIQDSSEIDLDQLYGSKAKNIEAFLETNTDTSIQRDDIVQLVLSTHNQLKSKK